WRARDRDELAHVVQLSPLALPVASVCRMAHRPLAITISGVPGDVESVTRFGRRLARLTRRILRDINAAILCPSARGIRNLAEHDFLLPGTRLGVTSRVDTRRFRLIDEDGSPARARTVVCVAQFRHQKGLDVLLNAWRLVQDRRPDARLIIVGAPSIEDEGVHATLMRLIATHGLDRSV